MAVPEITPQMLLNELDNMDRCISDYIVLVSEKLPHDSNLDALGVLIMEHHSVLTSVLMRHLSPSRASLN